MSLAEPFWLFLAAVVIPLGLLVVWFGVRHNNKVVAVFGEEMGDRVLPARVRRRRWIRDGLVGLSLLLVVFALAEPRFGKQLQTVEAKGTDLVVALDLSRSMNAEDVSPSRLERAKREIRDLLKVVEGDRVGLVLYAGGAVPRLPLTTDRKLIDLVVSEAETDVFRTQGSDLASALRESTKLLTQGKGRAGKAILVISDGEVHQPDDALAAADEAAMESIAVFVMGVGEESAPIPVPEGGYLQWKGKTVQTEPDFEILKDVAQRTSGAFVQSVASNADIESLYWQEIRRKLVAVQRDSQQREKWRTAFQLPAGLALGFLLLAGWLSDGRRAFGAASALFLAVLVLPSPAHAQSIVEADRLFRSGEYARAAEQLTDLSLREPTNPDVYRLLGAARYRAGDYDAAARAFERADQLAPDANSAFNAGNAHYRSGRLEEALKNYDQVVARDPSHPSAAANREMVAQEIEERRKIQPPPPPPPEQGGGGDEEPKEGDPQEGDEDEPKPSPGEGEGEEPKDGEQGEEPNEGKPEEGESDEKADQKPGEDGKPGEGEPEESENQGEGEQQDSDEQSDAESGDASESEGDGGGPITENQAHRLLDAVEEGKQRLSAGGQKGGKPW